MSLRRARRNGLRRSRRNVRAPPGADGGADGDSGCGFLGRMGRNSARLSTENGHEIWEINTAHEYKTVNGVKANGGSMGSAGPTDRRRHCFSWARAIRRPGRDRKRAAGLFAELEIRQFPRTSSEQKLATLARHRNHPGPGMERRRVTARRGLSCRRGAAGDALGAAAPGRDDADSGKRLRIGGGISLHGRNHLEARGDQSDRRSRRQSAAPGREDEHRSCDAATRGAARNEEYGAGVFRGVGMRRLRQGVYRATAAARAARARIGKRDSILRCSADCRKSCAGRRQFSGARAACTRRHFFAKTANCWFCARISADIMPSTR